MSAYVPTMAEEFNQANGGDLWKLKGAYMYVAAAAWDLVLRNLLKNIDAQVNWVTANKETVKQAAKVYKKQTETLYFGMVESDEVHLATNIGNLYYRVAQYSYQEKQLQQPALALRMVQDQA
ncbi:MAG: hypothetical protein EZS28_042681 [Streblomastix strix]|uniref:Uncharacterized protein n=1 Tax=Streblomastix strix TaxID=222440 RepID=A0A5J4TV82_9EUKA|nr:MAG: hypothetical protein EZS28_042681 [Streblomastix strix]